MNDNIWDELEIFIRKEAGVFPGKNLDRDTSLEDDLDITGDDAVDFMRNFFDYFNVDIGDIDLRRYFYGEGSFLYIFIKLIFNKKSEKSKMLPLTLRMLEKAIILKKWDTNTIENSKD